MSSEFSVQLPTDLSPRKLAALIKKAEVGTQEREVLEEVLSRSCNCGAAVRMAQDGDAPTMGSIVRIAYEKGIVSLAKKLPDETRALAFNLANVCYQEAHRYSDLNPKSLGPVRRAFAA